MIFVRPLNGVKVPYPKDGGQLPAGGAYVEDISYWRRRIADGSVEIVPGVALPSFRVLDAPPLSFASMADFTAYGAANYGVRPVWIAGQQYWCDGNAVKLSSKKTVLKNALFLGTSITNFLSTGTNKDQQHESNSWVYWLMAKLGQPFSSWINAGIAGNTTNQMLARYTSDVANHYGNFDVMFFEPGPNDYSDDTISFATIQSNIQSIVEQSLSVGKLVVILTPTPSESITTAGKTKRSQVLGWLIGYADTLDNCVLVNTDQVMADPATGNPLPAMYMPTSMEALRVHPSAQGGAALGKLVAAYVAPFMTKSNKGQPKQSHLQYMPNSRLNGSNANGTDHFHLHASVSGTGPSAFAAKVAQGAFTSVAIAAHTDTGLDDYYSAGGVQITANAAGADQSMITLAFGSDSNVIGGTQYGYMDGNHGWPGASGSAKIGEHYTNASYPGGMWTVISAGTTSSASVPNPISATNYGEIKADGSAVLMWQKQLRSGDILIPEVAYEITSLTGAMIIRARASAGRNTDFGTCWFPFFDNTPGSPSTGLPGPHIPKTGILRGAPFTLADDGNPARYAEIDVGLIFTNGSSATVVIKEVNLIRK